MVTYNVGDGGNGTEETAWVTGEGPKPTATASTHRLNLDRLVKMLQILACLPVLDAKIEHSYYRSGQTQSKEQRLPPNENLVKLHFTRNA